MTSWYAPPETLTNLKFRFMLFVIPSEKQWSSSRMYSLNVAPFHLPIFCICVSEYPARESALAPPLRRECVSIRSIGIPRIVGYCKIDAAIFNPLLMSSPHTSYRALFWKNVDKKVLPLALFSRRCNTRLARARTGHLKASPLASRCTQTPFHPFFLVI